MICILKFTKGHNFVKTVDKDMILALCTSSDNAFKISVQSFVKVSQRISE